MNTRVLSLLLFTLVSFAAMLFWFIQRAPVPQPPVVAKAPAAVRPPPVALPPKADAVTVEAAEEPRRYRPKPVTAAVRRKVNDFIRRYKDVPPEELGKNAEVTGMMGKFVECLNTPEFQKKMEGRLDAITAAKGKGLQNMSLNIGGGDLESPEGQALLEALFSEDSDRLEDYVFNKIDGAIFELSFDPTLEQTESGVTLKPAAVTSPPAGNKLPD